MSWDKVEERAKRVAACPGHDLKALTREEQVSRQTYKAFECKNCGWFAETGERNAYYQGLEHGAAKALVMSVPATAPAAEEMAEEFGA